MLYLSNAPLNARLFKIHHALSFTRKRFNMFKNKLGDDSPIPKYISL